MNEKRVEPDCRTCWRRETCPKAKAGTFCQMWQERKPEPKGDDPNDLWRRGKDVTL